MSQRILIADDHDLVRDTIAAFISAEGDFAVATVEDLPSALDSAAAEGPFDLVLLDYNMPGMEGLGGLTRMISANGARPVAVMSGTAPKAVAEEAMAAGAMGFLPKTMGAKSLLNAIRFMVAGERYVPVSFLTEPDAAETNPLAAQLTQREKDVLGGLVRGLSNKEIARELNLQEVTIKLHVKTLSRKLDAKNRTQAAILAKEHGLA